ncbi:hypothetical protein [Streptomyces sp. NPDC093795]|uniref:hypothetical protein n=1 Tax=Streptomyces sp. NPDC093795 TaxID=3366051 RepID=UPI0038230248
MIINRRSRRLRSVAAALAVLAASVTLSGCGTDSPPQHEERLNKAAGVAQFSIVSTQDMWDRTRQGGRPQSNGTSFDEVKPRKLGGEQGRRGLIEVTLTGPQLVEYLRKLDYDAHGGNFRDSADEPLARRMYDAIVPVVDRIEPGKAPAEVPSVSVDDAVAAGPPPAFPTTAPSASPRPPAPSSSPPK